MRNTHKRPGCSTANELTHEGGSRKRHSKVSTEQESVDRVGHDPMRWPPHKESLSSAIDDEPVIANIRARAHVRYLLMRAATESITIRVAVEMGLIELFDKLADPLLGAVEHERVLWILGLREEEPKPA